MLVGTTFSVISGQMLKVFRDHAFHKPKSQTDIATALDTSVMSISRLEKGTGELTVSDMDLLAHYFGLKPEQFFGLLLQVKHLLIQQGCVILPTKHHLKTQKNFKKLDRGIIYDLCKKISGPFLYEA